jgi:hypothetical protein
MPGIRPQPDDILEVRTVCTNADQLSLNVYHYRTTFTAGPAPGVTIAEMAASLSAIFSPGYQTIMPASAVYRGTGVKNMMIPPTQEATSTAGAGPGVASGSEIPQQVTYLVNFKTANSGRGFRGRVYPGFVANSFVNTSGNMNAAGFTAIQLMAATIVGNFTITSGPNQTTIQLVILRRQANKLPLLFPTTADVITITARNAFATQRRRGDFGRTNTTPLGF